MALITLRGIPVRNIFIIDQAENVGGCLYQANTFGWFGGPSNPLAYYPFPAYGTCYHKLVIRYYILHLVCSKRNSGVWRFLAAIYNAPTTSFASRLEYYVLSRSDWNKLMLNPVYRLIKNMQICIITQALKTRFAFVRSVFCSELTS